MVSLSRMVRSEMVGLVAGSNLEEMASSEHLKNPQKAKNGHGVECTGGTGGLVTRAEGVDALGEDV